MTTYPINFPPRNPANEKLQLSKRQGVSTSPWTQAQQITKGGAQWRLEWTWARMSHAEAEVCSAWLDSLDGQRGTFWYQPRQAYSSALIGRSVSTKAYQFNNAVSAAGWSAGAPSLLRVGQLIQIDNQLLRITSAPSQADISGHCLISFEPSLRKDFEAGTAINFVNPRGLFSLASSEGTAFTLDPDRAPEFPPVSALEAIQ